MLSCVNPIYYVFFPKSPGKGRQRKFTNVVRKPKYKSEITSQTLSILRLKHLWCIKVEMPNSENWVYDSGTPKGAMELSMLKVPVYK